MICSNYLKRTFFLVSISLMSLVIWAQDTSVVKMNSSATGLISFTIKLQRDRVPVYVDWGDGKRVTCTGAKSNTITGMPVGNKTIKVYTDSITYLYCGSSQVTSIDVSKCSELTYLDCEYNLLETLDVSNNTKLIYLSFYANKLESIDFSKNLNLTTLWCAGNLIKSLDVSKNSALVNLYCFSNEITSLDVSKNKMLQTLDCGNNKLTALDVSANTELQYLFCYLNSLSQVDVTNNTNLLSLWCYNNQLSTIDVSKNLGLVDLYCDNNKISSLDLSNNLFLNNLNIASNLFSFSSFPMNKGAYNSFLYDNQAMIDIPGTLNGLYNPANIVDLSSQVIAKDESGDSVTTFVWRTIKEGKDVIMTKDTDYVVVEVGKFRFSGEFVNGIYCVLTNSVYPDITLRTISVKLDKKATIYNSQFANPISIYPVPSKNFINISGVQGVRVNIFDLQGSKLKTIESYNGGQIDISSLKAGVYVLEANYKFSKFIKQ